MDGCQPQKFENTIFAAKKQKMRYTAALILMAILTACTPDAEKLKAELKQMDEVFSASSSISDLKKAERFITVTKRFAEAFPADSLAPYYLFKSAGVAKMTGKFEEAYQLWDQLIADYPDHLWSPPAAFLRGFTAENDLADRSKAVKYFEEFLRLYPNHDFAGQAQTQINLLKENVSPEDMVKQFEQNLPDTTVVE